MDMVHIFCCLARFRSEDDPERFVLPTYTDDGDLRESDFMREIGLSNDYEPMAIEIEFFSRTTDLLSALCGFSYSTQFRVVRVVPTEVNSVVCVYSPNSPDHPARSSLDYVGAFRYDPNGG
ncbi:immunity 22 family protein [Aeoliella sp.]|uniref:immunity 22 family protein n=1 Tax=Aeoliella sp. TaxID=2795800 RepID=UPI003CCB986B